MYLANQKVNQEIRVVRVDCLWPVKREKFQAAENLR